VPALIAADAPQLPPTKERFLADRLFRREAFFLRDRDVSRLLLLKDRFFPFL